MQTLLPALFPFFITCGLLTSAVGRKGGFAAALLLSWLGGYAVCAGLVRDLLAQGKLSARRAELLLLLGCCSGPGFVIGSVGGYMLDSVGTGIVLYTAQLAANLLCAALLYPQIRRKSAAPPPPETPPATAGNPVNLSRAIIRAADSCLYVCGTVIFFRMVQAVLSKSVSLPDIAAPFLSAFLEISSGCSDFSRLEGRFALYGLCLCLSVLSASVFVQLHALLEGAVGLRFLVCSRLLHIPLMILLVSLALRYLPGNAAAFSSLAPRVLVKSRIAPDAAVVIFLFLCAVLYKFHKKNYNEAIGKS